MNLDEDNKVFHLAFTCSNSARNLTRNRSSIFKVNNKNTRTNSGLSIVNSEDDSYFITELKQINVG